MFRDGAHDGIIGFYATPGATTPALSFTLHTGGKSYFPTLHRTFFA